VHRHKHDAALFFEFHQNGVALGYSHGMFGSG
jgi:hypothetical protein